jgi:hypothetical protein
MRTGKKCLQEKFAYENSDKIIHVSEKFIDYCNRLYKIKPSQVILSSPSKKYITIKNNTNINKVHYDFVYQGGIFDPSWKKKWKYSYRNYFPIFKSILDEGHHLHLFTKINEIKLPTYAKLNEEFNTFHMHGHLEYKDLILKMSEYDFGLAGFNFDNIESSSAIKYLNAALGNKMFDYLSAGIPVITFNANAMTNFLISNKCGLEKTTQISWNSLIEKKIDTNQIKKIANKFCMENQIKKLINIYEELT